MLNRDETNTFHKRRPTRRFRHKMWEGGFTAKDSLEVKLLTAPLRWNFGDWFFVLWKYRISWEQPCPATFYCSGCCGANGNASCNNVFSIFGWFVSDVAVRTWFHFLCKKLFYQLLIHTYGQIELENCAWFDPDGPEKNETVRAKNVLPGGLGVFDIFHPIFAMWGKFMVHAGGFVDQQLNKNPNSRKLQEKNMWFSSMWFLAMDGAFDAWALVVLWCRLNVAESSWVSEPQVETDEVVEWMAEPAGGRVNGIWLLVNTQICKQIGTSKYKWCFVWPACSGDILPVLAALLAVFGNFIVCWSVLKFQFVVAGGIVIMLHTYTIQYADLIMIDYITISSDMVIFPKNIGVSQWIRWCFMKRRRTNLWFLRC